MATPEYSNEELLVRAMRSARSRDGKTVPRWAAVRDVFSTGSTVARALCVRFGLDPNEEVKGFCVHCKHFE